VYDTEFQIGLYAVNLLREKTGCEVLRDEAAFVAMHFLNNRMDLIWPAQNRKYGLYSNSCMTRW
ncbi:MAG TPA: PRD domain-containing protein, partial [Candidatus Anaerobutyricum stercoris]|nr:PRD domain-containing protein [Candidatus Anaerobutyricum stercoris]